MAKKIIIAVVVLGLALAAFFGGRLYASLNNTAERAANAFMANVSKADAETSYKQLTPNYQKSYAMSDWDSLVHTFKDYKGAPKLVKQEEVTSSFNTYTDKSNPQRFVYEMQLEGRTYQVKVVMLKVDRLWKVDDLQGYYKK